jgi:hypothetical protein
MIVSGEGLLRYSAVIDFSYVHSSGGKVLMLDFIRRIGADENKYAFIFDSRHSDVGAVLTNSFRVRGILHREVVLAFLSMHSNKILSFNNVSSIFGWFGKEYIFFQNVLFLGSVGGLRWFVKRIVFNLAIRRRVFFIVQGKSVQVGLNNIGVSDQDILIAPFFSACDVGVFENHFLTSYSARPLIYYPSDGQSHKNHLFILECLDQLRQAIGDFTLVFTLSDKHYDLKKRVQAVSEKGFNVIDLGLVSRNRALALINLADINIYASSDESFGLGLIEVAILGGVLVAPSLSYVDDVVSTDYRFEPNTERSFIEAVVRALHHGKACELIVEDRFGSIVELLEA